LGHGSQVAATTASPERRIAMGLEALGPTIREHTNALSGKEVEWNSSVAAQQALRRLGESGRMQSNSVTRGSCNRNEPVGPQNRLTTLLGGLAGDRVPLLRKPEAAQCNLEPREHFLAGGDIGIH
jgi:hypothetical protein